MFNQNAEYAFNLPCRRLAAVAPSSQNNASKSAGSSFDEEDSGDYFDSSASSSTSHRFLVGTAFPSVSKLSDSNEADGDDNNITHNLSIIEEDDENRTNRVYLMQYHEDSNELSLETSFVHPMGEIWSMACHPKKADWVATCGGGAVFSPMGEEKKENDRLAHFQTTLWKTPDSSAADDDDGDDEFDGTTITKNNSADSDDFWSENNINNQESNRNRTVSAASGVSTSAKLEPVLTIPHGQNLSSTSGWEQRVGQILWNPLLHPNSSSGDALMDLAETSSHEGGGNIITVGWDARSPITLWDISSMSEAKEVWSTKPENETASFRRGRGRLDRFSGLNSALPRRASWDPHEGSHILATAGVDVVAYDMRCPPREVGVIRSAHRYGVTDVCHNHLQSNVVITSGMDGIVKFFDLRMHLSQRSSGAYLDTSMDTTVEVDRYTPPPLLKAVRGGHSHWAIRAACNPFYDQLILSGGTDAIANLWRVSSCSSAPLLDLGGEEDDDAMNESYFDETYGEEGDGDDAAANVEEGNEEEEDVWNNDNDQTTHSDEEDEGDNKLKSKSSANESNADIRVTRFECSDVTADLTWSASDPWVYATLSCDGGLVVHHVPSKEKYKILL
mmetsp:Transcript_31651/g.47666  ORF Transcript_31651/g.47666 Transcript_31651/m.47666 type:complete len:617 (+) Transcript_31651:62-1912(+)|eukprot:scaffold6126_cov121-Skeletonema_dohrnii-CCMP3373.AAC.7